MRFCVQCRIQALRVPPLPARYGENQAGLTASRGDCVQTDIFFLFLLPPIIFNAGFNLEVKPCAPLLSSSASC